MNSPTTATPTRQEKNVSEPEGFQPAPHEMPTYERVDGAGQRHPATVEWAASMMQDGNCAVLVRDSVKPVGDGLAEGLMVAVCPDPDLGQYIAYMHNMILRGNNLIGTDTKSLLEAYATQTNPLTGEPRVWGTPTTASAPEATGGYL